MGIQINGNTNNINAGIGSLSIEDINELDIVGVATAANFKTGVSNLHDVGLTLSGGQIDVGSNIKIGNAGVITATSFVGSGANLTGITGTTINNNADNRIITGSGTANTLNGENNLTFDGHDLDITRSNSSMRLTVSSDVPKINFNANSVSDAARITIEGSGGGGLMKLSTKTSGGSLTERLRIASDGTVDFYGNQANAPNGVFGFRYDKSNDTDLSIENLDNGSVNNNAGIRLASNHGNIKLRYFNNGGFYVQNSSASGYLHYFTNNVSRFYIDSSGNVNINNQGTIASSNGALGKRLGIKSTANNVIIGETTQSGAGYGLHIESRQTGRSGNARIAQIGLKNDASGNGQISFFTAPSGADSSERMVITSDGSVGVNVSSPAQNLHVYDNTAYHGILVNGNGAPSVSFGHNTSTTPSYKFGLWGVDHTIFALTASTDHQNPLMLWDWNETGSNATVTTSVKHTFNGVCTFNGNYQQGSTSHGLQLYGSGSQSRGVVVSHGNNDFRPSHNNSVTLGTGSYRWSTVYSNNSLNTSDKNLKNTIADSDLGLSFINKLRPVSYKWNQKEEEDLDTKTHYGLIAQEVETALASESKTLDDFAAVFKPDDYKEDGTGGSMGLAYSEIVSPLIKAVQELSTKVETLESRISAIEGS